MFLIFIETQQNQQLKADCFTMNIGGVQPWPGNLPLLVIPCPPTQSHLELDMTT